MDAESIKPNKVKNHRYMNSIHIISFRNDKGVPTPCMFTYLSSKYLIHAKISKDKYDIQYSTIGKVSASSDLIDILHSALPIHSSLAADSNWKSSFEVKIKENLPFIFVKDFIAQEINKQSNSIKFEFNLKYQPFSKSIRWIAPIREKPKRTYDQFKANYSPEGSHIPYKLNELLGDRKKSTEKNELSKALEKFGDDSGMFKSIKINRYGSDNRSPFEVGIVLNNKNSIKISNVGYGVAQVLPIIVEMLIRLKSSIFAIQQPEVHLHPKAQASLGGLLFELAAKEK